MRPSHACCGEHWSASLALSGEGEGLKSGLLELGGVCRQRECGEGVRRCRAALAVGRVLLRALVRILGLSDDP